MPTEQGGPLQPIVVRTDAPIGGAALRVTLTTLPSARSVQGGAALPVVYITDAQVAAGYPVQGNTPVPVAVVSDGRPTLGQRALAVYVVGGGGPLPPATPPDAVLLRVWYDARTISGYANGDPVVLLDRSGNAVDADTSTARPTYQVNAIGSNPGVRFNGTSQYLRSDSFTLAQSFSIYILFRSIVWGAGHRLIDGNTVNQIVLSQTPGIGDYAIYAGSAFQPGSSGPGDDVCVVISLVFDGASSRISVNQRATVINNSGANAIVDGLILGGAGNLSAAFFANIDLGELLIYPRADSPAQAAAVEGYLISKWQIAPQLFFDGDSLTVGQGSTPGGDYPTQLLALIGGNWTKQNISVGGQTVANMNSDATAQIDTQYSAVRRRSLCAGWAGTNDILFGASAATTYNRLTTFWAARRAAGWTVIAFTIIARGNFIAGQETIRQATNTLIRNDTSLYGVLVDLAADSRLSDSNNTTYFDLDTVHLTNAGYGVVAGLTYATIGGLL